MKKIFGLVCACAVMATTFVSVSAQSDNFLTKEWEKGTLGATLEKTEEDGETVYKAGNFKAAYTSPMVSVLDAIKEATGDDDGTVTITMKLRTEHVEGKESSKTQLRILMRGTPTNASLAKNAEEWNDAYEGEVEDASFSNSSGNIMFALSGKQNVTDDEWTIVEWTFDITKAEMDSTMLKDWLLCVDTISDNSDISYIYIKDTGVYLADDYESEVPEEEPIEKTEIVKKDMKVLYDGNGNLLENIAQGSTDNSQTGTHTPDGNGVTVTPGTEQGNPYWWIWVIGAVIAIGAVVAVVVIKKKKTNKANNE